MSEILLWKSVSEKKRRAAEHHGVGNIVKAVSNIGRDGDFDGEVNHRIRAGERRRDKLPRGELLCLPKAGAGGEKDCASQIGPQEV